jgi:hypothetical protein
MTNRRLFANLTAGALATLIAGWPALVQAYYVELAPGGLLAAGTSYSDYRTLWVGGVRLALGLLALFTLIKAIQGYFGYLTHGGSQDAMDGAFTSMGDAAKILILAVVGAALAPTAVNLVFDIASNGVTFG